MRNRRQSRQPFDEPFLSLMRLPDRAKEVVHRALLLDRRSVPSRALATTYADFLPTASASTLVTKALRETPSRAAMIFNFSCKLRGAR
jgi:hypothetical protein